MNKLTTKEKKYLNELLGMSFDDWYDSQRTGEVPVKEAQKYLKLISDVRVKLQIGGK